MASRKILCVDDSALIRKIVVRAAEVLGFEVIEAGNGKEALALVEAQAADIGLVTLDWHMPEMDGLRFLTAIKSQEATRHIPVLMVTSESSKDNIVKAIKAGVANYLLKPFAQEDLITKMRECMGQGR